MMKKIDIALKKYMIMSTLKMDEGGFKGINA